MLNMIASARQPNAVLPTRTYCSCLTLPRVSEKLKLQVKSSIGASVVVAVATTPLEIVKTRLQIAPSFDATSKRVFTRHSKNLFSSCSTTQSSYQILRMILKREGASGLWTGTGAAIVHAVPSVSIYLVCYEQLKSKFEDLGVKNALSPILAGALARSLSVLITVRRNLCSVCNRNIDMGRQCPLDVVRTQKMAADSITIKESSSLTRTVLLNRMNVFNIMQQLVVQNGWRSLWRGLGPALWRDVPFSALYWLGAEGIRTHLKVHI